MGEFFACPVGNVARKTAAAYTDDPAACLLALFTADHIKANTVCKKSFVQPAPTVYQVSARRFITYGETRGTLYCRGSTYKTEFHTRAYGAIYLPPGCSIDAEAFTITSSDAAYTRDEDDWGFTASFNVSLGFFTEGINATALSQLVGKARATTTAFQRIDFTRARQMLAQADAQGALPAAWHIPLLALSLIHI